MSPGIIHQDMMNEGNAFDFFLKSGAQSSHCLLSYLSLAAWLSCFVSNVILTHRFLHGYHVCELMSSAVSPGRSFSDVLVISNESANASTKEQSGVFGVHCLDVATRRSFFVYSMFC